MITELSYYISDSFNPYHNLAVEETLLESVRPGQMILYLGRTSELWSSEKIRMLGRNVVSSSSNRTAGILPAVFRVEGQYSTIWAI